MFKNALDYIGDKFKSYTCIVGFFVIVWVATWFSNGLIGTKFDLNSLREFFFAIVAKYGIDSYFNTNKGEAPK